MKLLEKLSKKIGFTRTETNVILFILIVCLIGLTVNIIKFIKNDKAYLEFDYKKEDSLFNAASGDPGLEDSVKNQQEKKIDSNRELLDFTKEKLKNTKAEKNSVKKIVSINSASVSVLTSLPGIGQKTANAIIEYRNKHGGIKSLVELLNIKGIGKTKLSKIKSLISLD